MRPPVSIPIGGNHRISHDWAITASEPSQLSEKEKLARLQQLDRWRQWRSLTERRFCLGCRKTITGREIEVGGGIDEPFRLRCPTENCSSIPMDWILPNDYHLEPE